MSEVSDRYRRVATGFAARLEHCPPDGLEAPSPCEGWKARDVVSHVVHVHRRVVAGLDGSEASEPQHGEDLAEAFSVASAAVSAALDHPQRASQTVSGLFGAQSFEDLVGRLLCADTLVHTWDLARATGQDDRLDIEAATKALESLIPMDEAMRRPGGFGPRADAAALDGAEPDVQAQLIAFTGRHA